MSLIKLLIVSLVVGVAVGQITRAQHKFMQRAIRKRLFADILKIPRLAQLSFHDCVGGCDGCVNLENPENRGLDSTVEFVEDFRDKFAPQLSIADIMAFAGTEALIHGARNGGNEIFLPYWIGRKDCDNTKPKPMRDLPHNDNLDSVGYLQKQFNLTKIEAVALLGVHSLGATHSNRSGFAGAWDNTPFALDSAYYRNMMTRGWEATEVDNDFVKGSAWERFGLTMLHADMTILLKFNITGPMKKPTCGFHTCPKADTWGLVRNFAVSDTLFLKELATAFTKMVSTGADKLTFIGG